MALNNRKLFPNDYKSRQINRARQNAVEALQQIERIAQTPNADSFREIQRRSAELARTARGYRGEGFPDQLVKTIDSIERMSKSGIAATVERMLTSLGTPGRLISSWLRGSEGRSSTIPIRDQVQRALQLMQQLEPIGDAPEISPEAAGGRLLPDGDASVLSPPVGPQSPSTGGGGRSRLPPVAPPQSPPDDDRPHRNVRVLPDGRWHIRGPGYDRILQANDPALLGQMIPARSSNVHSYGYKFNFDRPTQGSLIVRYLQKDVNSSSGGRKVPGPTYEYVKVHPDWFDDIFRASSKGIWIWDHMRIRGTVAGHQYSYQLIRAAQNYLPRRAVVRNGRQLLLQRRRTAERRDGSQYRLVSPLRSEYIGAYRPSVKRPNVGNMDRGTPNRGR